MTCSAMAFFSTNFMLHSSQEDEHQHAPSSLSPILPPCSTTTQDLNGVASFLGKRSMSSYSGMNNMDGCDQEGNMNNGEDELSDDGSQLLAGEKKRRLTMEQVKTLERNFELGNKLEPERKMQLARALGLQPRQIAIWFQNRRARWKTKQLEKDYDALKRQFEAVKAQNDSLQSQNHKLQAEVCKVATYVKIDMLTNKKDNNRMLLIEDNGGGMDPEKMRHCMSLGYSLKSKVKDTIGQYGNGFKTSTMRLGADVIVFSRCSGKNGKRSTQSIGLLSYTFLRCTGKEDIVVPMLDYEQDGREWKKMKRLSASDWDINLEAVVQWSPFSSESDLLKQFDHMKEQGTRIIIYNLWEDDQEQLELDFDTDKHDIQIRGVNRDEKNIEMAQQYPNSRHFLTYRHSLRSYASILYLRVPYNFRIILRGKDVEHHNIVNDMMMTNEVTYRPQPGLEGVPKDSNMVAVVTVGFVKDAKAHIDVQGFNVYHKNRLIKPFWRIWNAAGSDGRGVIGVLEANFVEPAHDKQGFERTTVLQRLETRLIQMQKTYWSTYCHKIGYAPRRHKKSPDDTDNSPDYRTEPSRKSARITPQSDKSSLHRPQEEAVIASPPRYPTNGNIHVGVKTEKLNRVHGVSASSSESASPLTENIRDVDSQTNMYTQHANGKSSQKGFSGMKTHTAIEVRNPDLSAAKAMQVSAPPHLRSSIVNGSVTIGSNSSNVNMHQLVEENRELKDRLRMREEEILGDLLKDLEFEKNRCKELEVQLEEEKQKYEALNKEQDSIIAIFAEERERRDAEEEDLRRKLKEAEATNKDLMEKVTQLQLEKMKSMGRKWSQ